MYRKQADRLIVRDVRVRLKAMEDPDWRDAVYASMMAHPGWFRHYAGRLLQDIGEMLQAAGVELVVARRRILLIGNVQPTGEA
jgi:hypothetical protein